MKVSELSGAMLDFEVGLAAGVLGLACTETECFWRKDATSRIERYSPSSDWSQAGPIIERELIHMDWYLDKFSAHILDFGIRIKCREYGSSMLEAAMRCYVASKFGKEVPDAK